MILNKYMLNIDNIYGVCECGCVMIEKENDVYRPEQIENYKEIENTYSKNFWCCNGCQNGYYKNGKEHSWVDKYKGGVINERD